MTPAALPARRAPAHRAPGWWWAVAVLAALVVAYAVAYVVVGPPMYPPNLAASFRARPWGIYPHASFGALALGSGALQFHPGLLVRRRDIRTHRAWMLRSYALIFAAATLRVELPLLIVAFAGSFTPAYQLVAWLCRVPNLAWAEWRLRRTRRAPSPVLRALGAA